MSIIKQNGKILLLLLCCILLLSPLSLINSPWTNHPSVKIAGPIEYHMNPDSPTWARLVMDFPNYFTTDNGKTRIQRPLYVVFSRVFYNGLFYFRNWVPDHTVQRITSLKKRATHPGHWVSVNSRNFVVAWASCILTNWLIFWLAISFVYFGLCPYFSKIVAFGLALIPFLHNDALHFYLMPHSEPFNLLIPALFVLMAGQIWPKKRTSYLLTSLMGVFMLGKGLMFPIGSWFYEYLWERPWQKNLRVLFLLILLFFLPLVGYRGFLKMFQLPVYNHEIVEYRQVIWMKDYFIQGRYFEIFLRWIQGLITHLGYTFWSFSAPVLGIAGLLLHPGSRPFHFNHPLLRHTFIYSALCAVFWMFVGLQTPGNAVTQFPLVLGVLGLLLKNRTQVPGRWLIAILAGQIVFHLI